MPNGRNQRNKSLKIKNLNKIFDNPENPAKQQILTE
jgi:hypothetical protein